MLSIIRETKIGKIARLHMGHSVGADISLISFWTELNENTLCLVIDIISPKTSISKYGNMSKKEGEKTKKYCSFEKSKITTV